MTLFLTSSPTGPLDGSRPVYGLDVKNGLVEQLAARWRDGARCLIVAAAPDEFDANDEMAAFFAGALRRSGLSCTAFDVWDDRTADPSARLLHSYDVVFLAGGHVPTQNAFFRHIGLRYKLRGFGGIVIGISAGSMDAAETVYAQPELDGETLDPDYPLFLPGLGLTDIQIVPHYQAVKDNWLDGRRLFEDITYGHSMGHCFLAIPDGSYVLQEDGRQTLYGEGWCIQDGQIRRIAAEGDVLPL